MKLSVTEARALGVPVDEALGVNKSALVDPEANRRAKEHARRMFLEACRSHGLPEPTWEVAFAAEIGREWLFDYLFDGWLALEIEGGVYGKGKPCPVCKRRPVAGHSSIERLKGDIEKYNAAALLGYVVVRCLPEDVDSGSVFPFVKQLLAKG